MEKTSPLDAAGLFRESLDTWFLSGAKDFPWRRTEDPYAILVSEMMLQQTQVATVLGKGYYTRFLKSFPDIRALAAADDETLLKAWEGLGYYRRARMLRATAKALLERHDGVFPQDAADLLALPGIGPYTAAALLSFAFNLPSDLVDGNVSRVLSRLMDSRQNIDESATLRLHRKWARELCDPANPRRHHSAMMELGQLICRPGIPHCEKCPVSAYCLARCPGELPIRKQRARVTELTEHAIWVRDPNGRLLLHLESGKRRNGLWRLPLRPPEIAGKWPEILRETYTITRYKVCLRIHEASMEQESLATEGDVWTDPEKLESLPMPAPFRKALARLLIDF